jgi:hypothetical protein
MLGVLNTLGRHHRAAAQRRVPVTPNIRHGIALLSGMAGTSPAMTTWLGGAHG